jgi:hypothetical protein
VPHGSAFSLKWSPWVGTDTSRTAILAYIARNYVGLRRVTIRNTWEISSSPDIILEDTDAVGICLHLSIDAFVEWEDMVRKANLSMMLG